MEKLNIEIWKDVVGVDSTNTFYNKERKVEATTDPSLGLPPIPQSFIEKYVEKQGNIKEVMIEMEENQCDGCKANIPINSHGLHDLSDTRPKLLFACTASKYNNIKLRKDGTVICSPVKDTWTRNEVIELIQKYNSDFKVFQDNEDWIEENI